jgi:hypothetical protein
MAGKEEKKAEEKTDFEIPAFLRRKKKKENEEE